MKIQHYFLFTALVLFSTLAFSVSAPYYKNHACGENCGNPLIDNDNIATADTKEILTDLICNDWVTRQPDVSDQTPWVTREFVSYAHSFTDTYIMCGYVYDETNGYYAYHGNYENPSPVDRKTKIETSGKWSYFTVPTDCEANQGDFLMLLAPVGNVTTINISDTPWLICNNSCSYDLGSRDNLNIMFTVTDQVFSDFGCGADIFTSCGAAAPLLATLQYVSNGESCLNSESGLTQEELLSNESLNDPCENGPGEYDPECITSGTITYERQGIGLTLEQIIQNTSFPLLGVSEDSSGSTDGWSLLNGAIDNGTSQYSSGDSSSNFTGDYITQINDYFGDSGGSGSGDGSGGGSSDGDVTVNVDVSGVISAINQSESTINANIDESQEILNEINDFNNNGLSDFVDPTTLIDDDPNFIERSTKITDIVGGTFKPFGEGWQGVFPTISGTGECPNIDFVIRDIQLDLTSEYFCKSMELITTSLDFMFFFFTIFQVFNLWRTALTEVI
jgi:hypothetical protein